MKLETALGIKLEFLCTRE